MWSGFNMPDATPFVDWVWRLFGLLQEAIFLSGSRYPSFPRALSLFLLTEYPKLQFLFISELYASSPISWATELGLITLFNSALVSGRFSPSDHEKRFCLKSKLLISCWTLVSSLWLLEENIFQIRLWLPFFGNKFSNMRLMIGFFKENLFSPFRRKTPANQGSWTVVSLIIVLFLKRLYNDTFQSCFHEKKKWKKKWNCSISIRLLITHIEQRLL